MKKVQPVDKPLFLSVIILIIAGFLIFSSASLGLLATSGNTYSSVAFNQTFYGLFGGTIAMLVASRIPYKIWRKYAFYLFVGSLILTAMVFPNWLRVRSPSMASRQCAGCMATFFQSPPNASSKRNTARRST